MKSIVLLGGGGHCAACIDVIELEGKYRIAGVLDRETWGGESLLGYPFIGTDSDIAELVQQGHSFLITVGQIRDPSPRQRLYELLRALQAPMATIISPRAYVSRHATVDQGTIVMHDALINANAEVGRNCIINTKTLIEHDACIEDHCHIATRAVVNGGVRIETGSFFGSGAISEEYARSGKYAFIKAGTVLKRHHE